MWTPGSIAEGFISPTPRWSNGWLPDARGGMGSHTSRCTGRPGSGVSEHMRARAPCRVASVCLLTRQCAARCCYLSFFLSSFIRSCFHTDLFHFIAAAADDPHRPWICIEKNRFKALCVEAGVPITERRYFSDVRPPSLLMHFDIIQELCVEEGTGDGGPAPQG